MCIEILLYYMYCNDVLSHPKNIPSQFWGTHFPKNTRKWPGSSTQREIVCV